MPIGDLYKTEVRELAEFMQIPLKISQKKSSARLWKGQTTGEIELAYDKIVSILMHIDTLRRGRRVPNIGPQSFSIAISNLSGRDKSRSRYSIAEVKRVLEIIEKNGHKLNPPPICRVGV
jgi:NAD+ synthase